MKILIAFFMLFLFLSNSCKEKEFTKNPLESYKIAKEPYDDKDYEVAITKLGQFKSRFPYSKFAVEAELLIANAHFNLGKYEEAAIGYEQFVKLHPKHPEMPYALFKVGQCYWMLAPDDVDREQEYTKKAIKKWELLIAKGLNNQYVNKAKKLILKGKRRVAGSMEFIAKFYCKQEIYQACAFNYINLAKNFGEFADIRKRALEKAADALIVLAKQKEKNPKDDSNIYFYKLNANQIRKMAKNLRMDANNVQKTKQ